MGTDLSPMPRPRFIPLLRILAYLASLLFVATITLWIFAQKHQHHFFHNFVSRDPARVRHTVVIFADNPRAFAVSVRNWHLLFGQRYENQQSVGKPDDFAREQAIEWETHCKREVHTIEAGQGLQWQREPFKEMYRAFDDRMYHRRWFLQVPFWQLALLLSPPPLWLTTRGILRWRAVRRRAKTGRCKQCGYDLRASKDRCPECGTPIPPAPFERPVEKQCES
jgi:hypothetical protein